MLLDTGNAVVTTRLLTRVRTEIVLVRYFDNVTSSLFMPNTVNFHLADTLVLWTLSITDKIQSPGRRGLT